MLFSQRRLCFAISIVLPHEAHAEERATIIAGSLLFVLAAFVVLASSLSLLGLVEARSSPVGVALLILAGVVMPWLVRQKRCGWRIVISPVIP